MNEHYWALLGSHDDEFWWSERTDNCEGQPCLVSFDPYFILDNHEKVVGFYHTHPGMIASPSSRDHRTMHAWITCLAKPLVCCIKGVDGLRAHWYFTDEDPPIEYPVREFNNIVFGLQPDFLNKQDLDYESDEELIERLEKEGRL